MNIPISVLLPVYKEPQSWIAQAIESILQQTFKKFELLLLVDHPRDKKLITFLQTYQTDTRVKLIINKQNLGLPKNLNKGIDLSRGKYIARMDADDIALPQRLEKQYAFMEKYLTIDLCGSQVMKIDVEGKTLQPSAHYSDPELLGKMVRYTNIITHPTWFIRKEVFTKVGKYRNFVNAEDYDLVYRIINAKKQVTNLPETLMYWRIHLEGQTGGQSLIQKVCLKHIQQLNKERLKNGKDNFDEKKLQDLIQTLQLKYGPQQQKAQLLLLLYFQNRTEGKYLPAIICLIRSFLASPIQRNYYLDLLKAKIVTGVYFFKKRIKLL